MAKAKHKKNKLGAGLKLEKKKRLKSSTKKGILAICLFTAAVLAILSRFSKAGVFGDVFYRAGQSLFGWGFFLIPLVLVLSAVALLKSLHKDLFLSVFVGAGILTISVLAFLQVVFKKSLTVSRVGGWVGHLVSLPLLKFFGPLASGIILGALIIIGWLVTFNVSLKKLFSRSKPESEQGSTSASLSAQETGKTQGPLPFVVQQTSSQLSPESQGQGVMARLRHLTQRIFPRPSFQVKTIGSSDQPGPKPAAVSTDSQTSETLVSQVSFIPPTDLLESETGQPNSGDIKASMNVIQRTLQNFGIEVEMGEVNVGPTVTQYTLKPAVGVKLSKITALHSDLCLALAAHPLRIEAPIPGRSLVGIEVPNQGITTVRLKNLLEDEKFIKAKSPLTFSLGRDVAGEPRFADLTRMPHLLIAGATGTGKTICLNVLILSLLYRNTPETLKFILVDPKRVEFSLYNDIPHLLCPVILEVEKTVSTLRWAVAEMEKRFVALAESGSKDIESYNKKARHSRTGLAYLPYIVIVVDELADLMFSHGRDVEALVVRLAQMARAVGIHLVLSTQRPSVEVITGLIKANITSRIALQVASQIDSRTILDRAGAEKLLGNGDMLFVAGNTNQIKRIQGAFVTEREVKRVADYLRNAGQPQYLKDMSLRIGKTGIVQAEEIDAFSQDLLFSEAKKIVIEAKKASASLLQRRLRIGYARAARLLDTLEQEGVVGPQEGSRPREILITNFSDYE